MSESAPGPAKRLLAVDDSADSAELVARVAKRSGYEAQAAADPHALRDVLTNWKPDVVTLDLCMPEEDGIEILSLLQDVGFRGKLIIISGQNDWIRKSAARLATARGLTVADDLCKPVDLKVLKDLLTGLQ